MNYVPLKYIATAYLQPIFKRTLLMIICSGFFMNLFSQHSLLDRELQFPEQKIKIQVFLKELADQGGFSFSYGSEVPLDKEVNIKPVNQSIRKHLDDIFTGDSLQFIEKGNKIFIIPLPPSPIKKNPEQTIRGRVLDIDSQTPLIGVNIILGSEGPVTGTITDENGYFKFERVPVGRHDLTISSVGYEAKYISNFLLGSGKELIMTVEMEESIVEISEVEITNNQDKSQPVNKLTLVSGRSFSSYEIENYPGSMSDISRAAVSLPGVLSTNDGQNHIVIRGNSPKGLQWRLEGIEIPNLNHFSNIGASGGGVGIISNNMISGSDFITSAFPAEYGNALSGIFDLKLRKGNSEKHEQTIQVGLIGTEVMVEGPLNKETNTTYIANYRYSTFKLIQKMGAPLRNIPDFQDLSFKIYHPTKKLGVFSFFGIGGLSHEEGLNGYIMNSNMSTIGISNNLTINPKSFLKSIVAFSGWNYNWNEEWNIGTDMYPIDEKSITDVKDFTLKGSIALNRKINTKHKVKVGLIYELAFNDSYIGLFSDTLFNWFSNPFNPGYQTLNYEYIYTDANTHASTIQSFVNWKYRIGEKLTLNSGLHFIEYFLNNNYSVEPRLSLQWRVLKRHTFSAGFGIHSKKESMTLYTGTRLLPDGSLVQPNIDLELAKARHYVLGYNFQIGEFMNLKAEAYYQSLYDIPASPDPPYISSINFDYGYEDGVLENYGTAYNKGAEITLEKNLSKGFHFLLTGSLYESKYKSMTGEWLNTKYNGNFASNGIISKDFILGRARQNIIRINTRYIFFGGMRYLPIDREESIAQGKQVRIYNNGFTEKASDYFRVDLQIRYIRNRTKYTSEIGLDIMNLTNHQNLLYEYWDRSISDFNSEYQNPLIPIIKYRIQF